MVPIDQGLACGIDEGKICLEVEKPTFGSLFYDAFSVTRQCSVNDRVTSER
jgi:hypothetical protein